MLVGSMVYLLSLVLVNIITFYGVCNGNDLIGNDINLAKDEERIQMVVDIIVLNWKNNGWTNLFVAGNLSDSFFTQLHINSFTSSVTDFMKKHRDIRRTVPYDSNTIIINCLDFKQFEIAMPKTVKVPYWHPLSNIILYYHRIEEKEVLAKMFFIFWYYRAVNVITIQYDDAKELLLVSQFNPFTCDYVKVQYRFGCWMRKKLNMPINSFENSFICEEGCHNVPLDSKRRFNNLGVCLGFETYQIPYSNKAMIRNLTLFKDKGKNLQGCALRAFAVEVLPFLEITENNNGSFSLKSRDGILWNTMAKRMNFTIDLSMCKDMIKEQFNFEANIQQVFAFIQRKVDLLLYPVYQFDIVIAEIDNTIAFKESGVCFLSHRAKFETTMFDVKLLQKNVYSIVQYNLCFCGTWFVFLIYNAVQLGHFNYDQAGKDLMNAFRTILSISLYNPPKKQSFRIFLTTVIWSFFVINFSTQAVIISLFSTHKRGKEVDSMEDILEKGYAIEGVASPDMVLPESEEKFRLINARRVPIQDLFGCVNAMDNDSRRFCAIDCAVGRYLERNRLNSKGQQYLHVATKDRLHSHYLNMILHRHSPLTATYNKIALSFVEAGLIKKWEEYRFNDIKEEPPVKAISLEDIIAIFQCYAILVGTSLCVFFIEMEIGVYTSIKIHGMPKVRYRIVSLLKKIRKQNIKRKNLRNKCTQTI